MPYYPDLDLRGKLPENTFQNLVQVTGSILTDGLGSTINASASYSLTSSFSLNGGGSGTSLGTGSTYPITSSWSNNTITSSYISGSGVRIINGALQLFNPTNNAWYTLRVSGSTGLETLELI